MHNPQVFMQRWGVLSQIEGLSLKEIGDRLGKSDDAVRMLVARAMASLASTFERA